MPARWWPVTPGRSSSSTRLRACNVVCPCRVFSCMHFCCPGWLCVGKGGTRAHPLLLQGVGTVLAAVHARRALKGPSLLLLCLNGEACQLSMEAWLWCCFLGGAGSYQIPVKTATTRVSAWLSVGLSLRAWSDVTKSA